MVALLGLVQSRCDVLYKSDDTSRVCKYTGPRPLACAMYPSLSKLCGAKTDTITAAPRPTCSSVPIGMRVLASAPWNQRIPNTDRSVDDALSRRIHDLLIDQSFTTRMNNELANAEIAIQNDGYLDRWNRPVAEQFQVLFVPADLNLNIGPADAARTIKVSCRFSKTRHNVFWLQIHGVLNACDDANDVEVDKEATIDFVSEADLIKRYGRSENIDFNIAENIDKGKHIIAAMLYRDGHVIRELGDPYTMSGEDILKAYGPHIQSIMRGNYHSPYGVYRGDAEGAVQGAWPTPTERTVVQGHLSDEAAAGISEVFRDAHWSIYMHLLKLTYETLEELCLYHTNPVAKQMHEDDFAMLSRDMDQHAATYTAEATPHKGSGKRSRV